MHSGVAGLVFRRATAVIWLGEAGGREPCCWIYAAHCRNEAVINIRVLGGRDAPLVGLIADDIQPAGISAGEGLNALIRPQIGVLPVLSSVECERLRLDRTGTVAPRPREEELVK